MGRKQQPMINANEAIEMANSLRMKGHKKCDKTCADFYYNKALDDFILKLKEKFE